MTKIGCFKVINSRGLFVKSPFEVTSFFAKAKTYGYKHTAKRFVKNVRKLKAWGCKIKPEKCPYFENCTKYREQNDLLNECPIKKIIADVNRWKVAEYRFELINTEKVED